MDTGKHAARALLCALGHEALIDPALAPVVCIARGDGWTPGTGSGKPIMYEGEQWSAAQRALRGAVADMGCDAVTLRYIMATQGVISARQLPAERLRQLTARVRKSRALDERSEEHARKEDESRVLWADEVWRKEYRALMSALHGTGLPDYVCWRAVGIDGDASIWRAGLVPATTLQAIHLAITSASEPRAYVLECYARHLNLF